MNAPRKIQLEATESHLSADASAARTGTSVRLALVLADGTRLELEADGVVSWGFSPPEERPAEPVLVCTRNGKRTRARLAPMLARVCNK